MVAFSAGLMGSSHCTNGVAAMGLTSVIMGRGVAGGVTYVFNKVTVFMGIFLFPTVFAAIGQANATMLVILFPVTGLLAAVFLFREVYGYQLD